MTRSRHATLMLTLHSLLLLAANAGLAGLLALWLLGPALVLPVAAGVVGAALLASPLQGGLLLRRQGAVPLPPEHWASRVVAVLARRAGLPRPPRVWLLPDPAINALAVGDGEGGAIALTEGALRALDDDECAGVLAHEVAHLVAGDTRLLALAAVAGRITALLSQLALLLALFSLPLALFGAVVIDPLGLLLVALAPALALLLQLALARTREFAADRRAVALTGDPAGLARALERIEAAAARQVPPWLRPYLSGGHPWLRSHPATPERLRVLRSLPTDPGLPPLPRRPGAILEDRIPGAGLLRRLLRGLWLPR